MPDDSRIQKFKASADNVVTHLSGEYSKLQTGRASSALVEHAMVEAYGQRQELRTVAGISIQDARTIVIQPWDREILAQVEAALRNLDLGASPVNDGSVLRINLPQMTEDRRKQITKVVDQLAEEARISIRQQRDEIRENIKQEKDEDVRYTLLEQLDEAVKKTNDDIEAIRKKKAEEIMTV
jgi:ribosome recycling factor